MLAHRLYLPDRQSERARNGDAILAILDVLAGAAEKLAQRRLRQFQLAALEPEIRSTEVQIAHFRPFEHGNSDDYSHYGYRPSSLQSAVPFSISTT